ncbi:flavin monoamine oxidase family protein [Pseudoalteromonas rubra]|uniref:flavin monoamine oxidase family protein n=1 Tax=Pseudoalteromonas rubra TaxID=43658 RepID=UPI000F7B51FF|nr:FAD-dependent oxidoreductase [Pseudoalteromonas rubra]
MNKDTIIIGAGFTGLAAAAELQKNQQDFAILEASDRLGGRNFSFKITQHLDTPGVEYEHGSQYIGESQEPLWSVVKGEPFYTWLKTHYPDYVHPDTPDTEYNEDTLPPYIVDNFAERLDFSEQVLILRDENNEPKRFPFNKFQTPYCITGLPSGIGKRSVAAIGLVSLDILYIESCINVDQPWASDFKGLYTAKQLDSITLEQWLNEKPRRGYMTPTALDSITIAAQALLSVNPSEISALYFFWYCACNGGFFNEVNDAKNGPQQYWLRCGFGKVLEFMSKDFKDSIHYEQVIESVSVDEQAEFPVCLTLSDGVVHRAKKLIVAVSPHTANKIQWPADLDESYKVLMNQKMGRTLKAQVFYETSWWNDIDGTGWQGYSGGASYPVLWTMDNTACDANGQPRPCLMTFTIGDQITELEASIAKSGSDPDEALKRFLTKHISYLFTGKYDYEPAMEPIAITANLWAKQTDKSGFEKGAFIGGGPNTVFAPGVLTEPVQDGKSAMAFANTPWRDLIYFTSSEVARNLHPETPNAMAFINPKDVDKDSQGKSEKADNQSLNTTLAFASSQPEKAGIVPISQYSDNRLDLGYMNGGLYAGQYAAQQRIQGAGFEVPQPDPMSSYSKSWNEVKTLAYVFVRGIEAFLELGTALHVISDSQIDSLISAILGDETRQCELKGGIGTQLKLRAAQLFNSNDEIAVDVLAEVARVSPQAYQAILDGFTSDDPRQVDFLKRLFGQNRES